MKTKLAILLSAVVIMLGLESCSSKATSSDFFSFNAVNLSVENGSLSATAGITGTKNNTVTININGTSSTITVTHEINELPVMPGNEIEVRFTPSCPEQTEAYFLMPDGTSEKLTASSRTFKWTVPADFTPGMKIKGESHYETDDFIYNLSGTITLISLE